MSLLVPTPPYSLKLVDRLEGGHEEMTKLIGIRWRSTAGHDDNDDGETEKDFYLM